MSDDRKAFSRPEGPATYTPRPTYPEWRDVFDGLAALGAGLRAIGEAWERSVIWHGQRIGALTPDGSGVVLYEATGATWDAYGAELDIARATDSGVSCVPEPSHAPIWYTPGAFVGDRWPFTDVPRHAGPLATCPLCHPEAP